MERSELLNDLANGHFFNHGVMGLYVTKKQLEYAAKHNLDGLYREDYSGEYSVEKISEKESHRVYTGPFRVARIINRSNGVAYKIDYNIYDNDAFSVVVVLVNSKSEAKQITTDYARAKLNNKTTRDDIVNYANALEEF